MFLQLQLQIQLIFVISLVYKKKKKFYFHKFFFFFFFFFFFENFHFYFLKVQMGDLIDGQAAGDEGKAMKTALNALLPYKVANNTAFIIRGVIKKNSFFYFIFF